MLQGRQFSKSRLGEIKPQSRNNSFTPYKSEADSPKASNEMGLKSIRFDEHQFKMCFGSIIVIFYCFILKVIIEETLKNKSKRYNVGSFQLKEIRPQS